MTDVPCAQAPAMIIAIPARMSGLDMVVPRSLAGPEITTRCGSQTMAFAPIAMIRSTK